MISRAIIDKALNGDPHACGYLYGVTSGDPVKLTEIGEDVATAVNAAHERAEARLDAYLEIQESNR